LRLTYKIGGKTVTKSFANPAAQRKAEHELQGFWRYQELGRAYVEVNAQIRRAPPAEGSLSA